MQKVAKELLGMISKGKQPPHWAVLESNEAQSAIADFAKASPAEVCLFQASRRCCLGGSRLPPCCLFRAQLLAVFVRREKALFEELSLAMQEGMGAGKSVFQVLALSDLIPARWLMLLVRLFVCMQIWMKEQSDLVQR